MKIHKIVFYISLGLLLLSILMFGLILHIDSKIEKIEGISFSWLYFINTLSLLTTIGLGVIGNMLVKSLGHKLSEQIARFMGITDTLNKGTNDLSRRTNDQAASLEETASTMEQITSTVKQNSEHSKLAVNLTNEALKVAQEGTHLSKEVQGAMDEISGSSSKISDIVGLVEEIAFQTNILAINAAIEAAKAGDIGKGFAVVAIEVRDLAQRSADAAKEIKTLIDTSIAKVQRGSELVVHSNQNLLNIAEGIQKVADIMGDVSSATNEQFTAIDQISDTVTQLDSATQDNTALVDSLTNSSDKLKDIVFELNLVVSNYLGKEDINQITNNKKSVADNEIKTTNKKSTTVKSEPKEMISKEVINTETKKIQVKQVPPKTNLTKKPVIKKTTGLHKPEVKKVETKKIVPKKTEVKKVEVPNDRSTDLAQDLSDKVEFFDDSSNVKNESKPVAKEHKTKSEEKSAKPKPKTPKAAESDDVVESILSRDPNFFDSGEDF